MTTTDKKRSVYDIVLNMLSSLKALCRRYHAADFVVGLI